MVYGANTSACQSAVLIHTHAQPGDAVYRTCTYDGDGAYAGVKLLLVDVVVEVAAARVRCEVPHEDVPVVVPRNQVSLHMAVAVAWAERKRKRDGKMNECMNGSCTLLLARCEMHGAGRGSGRATRTAHRCDWDGGAYLVRMQGHAINEGCVLVLPLAARRPAHISTGYVDTS